MWSGAPHRLGSPNEAKEPGQSLAGQDSRSPLPMRSRSWAMFPACRDQVGPQLRTLGDVSGKVQAADCSPLCSASQMPIFGGGGGKLLG